MIKLYMEAYKVDIRLTSRLAKLINLIVNPEFYYLEDPGNRNINLRIVKSKH